MVELGDFRDTLKGQRIAGRVVNGSLKPYETRADIEAEKLSNATPLVLSLIHISEPTRPY